MKMKRYFKIVREICRILDVKPAELRGTQLKQLLKDIDIPPVTVYWGCYTIDELNHIF